MKNCERFWNSNLMKMFGLWQPIKIKPSTNEQLFFGAYTLINKTKRILLLKRIIRKYQSIVITVCIKQFWWNAHIPF
jgi:hypothetical protein